MNIKRSIALVFSLLPGIALGNCISPMITPRECDFKHEDTQLWLWQPGAKFTNDNKYQTSIDSAHEFVEQYYNAVKTTGDDLLRIHHAGKAAAQELINTLQTVQIVEAESENDPWNLKTLYTDALCELFYTGLAAATGIESGDCFAGWTASVDKLQSSYEAIRKIEAIITNPYLVLGEQWGDVADDLDRVRAQYNELETMASNLNGEQMQAALNKKFTSFEQMLINPTANATYRAAIRPLIDATRDQTVRDTLMATQAQAKNLLGAAIIDPNDPAIYVSDLDEVQALKTKNQHALGRMQAVELNNMSKSLAAQAWLDMTEQTRANGYLFGLDMKAELDAEAQGRATWYHYTEELHPPSTRLDPDDGVAVGF